MKNIQDIAALFFIVAIFILTAISILGVWDIFSNDIISKSFQTLGLLALVSIIVMVSGKFIDKHPSNEGLIENIPNPVFKPIRHLTIGVLIISASMLALLGVLVIWEVISDEDILYKSIGSLAVLAFSSFIVIITSLEREGRDDHKKKKISFSLGGVIAVLVILWTLSNFLGFLF